MKKPFIIICLLFSYSILAYTQVKPSNRLTEFIIKTTGRDLTAVHDANPLSLFTLNTNTAYFNQINQTGLLKQNTGLILQTSKEQINDFIKQNKPVLQLRIPLNAQHTATVNLVKVLIADRSFSVLNSKGQPVEVRNTGIHYQGIIEGNSQSMVAISFFPSTNTLMGIISDESGSKIVGKIDDTSDNYILYNQRDITKSPAFSCLMDQREAFISGPSPKEQENASTNGSGCKTVKVYFEADNDLYLKKGATIQSTVDYLTGIFNQVSALYHNESVDMIISQIKVWDTLDPYASLTSTSSVVNSFKSTLNGNFNGDIAHFISGRLSTLGGGIAYAIPSSICNKSVMCCVSAIETTYSIIPTYSWTVNVITHEMGHILGSRHTHWCGWNGGAIDGCAGYVESDSLGNSCSIPGNPSGGGTIMSYCHQTSVGINLNLGFGPQPGNIIRRKIAQAACIPNNAVTDIPTNLSVNSIKVSSATLQWAAVNNSGGYYAVEYKTSASSTWLPAGVTSSASLMVTGLLANTSYVWRVKSACSASSTTGTFQTLAAEVALSGTIGSTFCQGSSFALNYTAFGIFNTGNVFTAQLSNASGSFASPVTIGTVTSVSSGAISCLIPNGTGTGTNYKIRVISTSPSLVSSNESTTFSITNSTAPSLTGFSLINPTNNSFVISAASDGSISLQYVVVTSNDLSPTAAQITQGLAANGSPALAAGMISLPGSNQVITRFISGLLSGTSYRVYVYYTNGAGCAAAILQQNTSTAGSALSYCTPVLNNQLSDYINSFSIPAIGLNNTSGRSSSGYETFLGNAYAAQAGIVYSFTLKTGNEYAQYATVWIDYNKNGSFETGEIIYQSSVKNYTHTGSFTIPSSTDGLVRLRAIVQYSSTPANPCTATNVYGEAEDYLLSLPSCLTFTSPPANPVATVISNTAVTVAWDAVPDATNYFLQFRKSGTANWDSTKTVSATSYTISNLSPGCMYEWQIKEKCSNNYSAIQTFTTTGNDIQLISTVGSSLCKGTSLVLNYTFIGCANLFNTTLIAQLSDATGSFATPRIIGYLNGPLSAGSVPIFIPLTSPDGSGYRVRLVLKNGSTVIVTGQPGNAFAITNQVNNGFTDISINSQTSEGFKIRLKTFSAATAYYVIVPQGDDAPSFPQIVSGKAANGYPALLAGNVVTQNSTDYYASIIKGLYPGKSYDVYCTVNDASACSKSIVKLTSSTTGTSPSYCTSLMFCDGNYQIGAFSIAGTDLNVTDNTCSGYTYYSTNGYAVKPGISYKFTLSALGTVPIYAGIWADFNKNGLFENSESVYVSQNTVNSHTGTITIPANTTPGMFVLRVIVRRYGVVPAACNSDLTGETNDFNVRVLPCKADTYLSFISPFDDVPAGENVTREANNIDAGNIIFGQGKATYYGKNSITLQPGFEAQTGATFNAAIDPNCSYPTASTTFLDK